MFFLRNYINTSATTDHERASCDNNKANLIKMFTEKGKPLDNFCSKKRIKRKMG